MNRKRPREEDPETSDVGHLCKNPKLEKSNWFKMAEPIKIQSASAASAQLPTTQMLRQQQFEAALVDAYDLQNFNMVWDCTMGRSILAEEMSPVHIVSPRFGDDCMGRLFGEDYKNELYSPRNGLALNNVAKSAIEAGILVIVPNIPNRPTPKEVAAWKASRPYEYKIRIIKPEVKNLIKDHTHADYIASLDDSPLIFKNSFRPRLRYLYFLFHMTMLRRATALVDGHALVQIFAYHRAKFNQQYWGVEDVNLKGKFWKYAPSNLRDPTDVRNVRTALESPNDGSDEEDMNGDSKTMLIF